jgi:hypothetical protein
MDYMRIGTTYCKNYGNGEGGAIIDFSTMYHQCSTSALMQS